ncbi:MAG: c-type cytochrome [Thermoanaerobaculia bacterium]|nr:c-type cytochrome [Thermoanaerobaculia bacterium]
MKVGRKKVDGGAAPRTIAASSIAALLVAALAGGGTGCSGRTFTKSMTLGGKKVSARRLNRGEHLYVTYCSACHGIKGDGKGPAAIGLRPPPRNFTQGQFKFAAVASGQLPNDEDFLRIIQKGLHGSAMLPWNDVPEREIMDIVQYIKTLSPKWADKSPGEPIVPGPDPWAERKGEAITRGMKVYHGMAQCLSCHPAYETKETINAASLELAKREATLRPDAYYAEMKDSDYGYKLMPPDFTRDHVRAGETLEDIYRTIASGIGGTAMPTWKGALPDDDIWAMAYYTRSLIEIKGSPAADARREKLVASLAVASHGNTKTN